MVFARTINFDAQFLPLLISLSPFILIFVYPIGVTLFIFCLKQKLETPKVKSSFGQFYYGIDLKKGNWLLHIIH